MLFYIVKDVLSLLFLKKYYFCIIDIYGVKMENVDIVGREYEQELIQNYLATQKPELVAIYGRRRVGKTFLVRKTISAMLSFSFTGMYETSRTIQLREFKANIERYSGRKCERPKDWFEAFDMLRNYLDLLQQDKIVVFLDELPWMDTPKSNFISAFSRFWNEWGSTKQNFKLFVCGSATSWMVSKFIGDKGGLYGRVCRSIHLSPFSLRETELFLRNIKGMDLNRRQIADIYMIMGGVPYYLDMLVKGVPLNKCIDDLFFRDGAPLREEYDFLFRSLFKDSKLYRKVVETLSDKMTGMSRSELLKSLKLKEGGNLTEVLDNLIKCDFIRKYASIGKDERNAQYQLIDNFTLFHLQFVANHNGQDEHFWSNIDGKPQKTSWSGFAFERLCLQHIRQIKSALGISGILSNVYAWKCKSFTDKDGRHWSGGQIDLLIDRSDNIITLCEMKYVSDKYSISADYEEHLRNRASLFATMTKSRKAIQHVFITTYGVALNNYSHIVQRDLTLDDLFCQ